MARFISTTVQGTPKCIGKGLALLYMSTAKYTVALSCGDRKSPDFLVSIVVRAEGKKWPCIYIYIVDYENCLLVMSTLQTAGKLVRLADSVYTHTTTVH